MLAYAADRPRVAASRQSPHAMFVILAAHIAVIAVVMSAKMDLPPRFHEKPTIIDLINRPQRTPPPPPHPQSKVERESLRPIDDQLVVIPRQPEEASQPAHGQNADVVVNQGGSDTATAPEVRLPVAPVQHDARLLTPPSELKPPYPAAKLLTEEEATLTLRLSIDSGGRVVAVEPVGRADRVFVDAARRHLLAHWRYQPATDGDRPVPSSVTITLRFMLDA